MKDSDGFTVAIMCIVFCAVLGLVWALAHGTVARGRTNGGA
jgi:hypothetical protein